MSGRFHFPRLHIHLLFAVHKPFFRPDASQCGIYLMMVRMLCLRPLSFAVFHAHTIHNLRIVHTFFFSFPRASFFLVFVSLRFRVLLLLLKFSFHFVFLFSSLDWYRPFPTNCLSLHWMPCMHYLITISITVKFIVNIFLCSVSHVAFYCTHSSHRLKLQFNENKTEIK